MPRGVWSYCRLSGSLILIMPNVHANLTVILDGVFKWLGLLLRIQNILGSNSECGLQFASVH